MIVQNDINEKLQKLFPDITVEVKKDFRNILHLFGEANDWKELVSVGHNAAKTENIKNVVNNMTVKGNAPKEKDYSQIIKKGKKIGVISKADVVIVGAGISGTAIARELSKYDLDIIVLEKSDDVATGATKANNGHIHPGNSVKAGTLKAKLNVEGNRMYTKWSEELGFTLDRCGSLGVVTHEDMIPVIEYGLAIAEINGVDGPVIIDKEEVYRLEPILKEKNIPVAAALHLPSTGLVEPYKVAVALAENAAINGVKFLFNYEVGDILHEDSMINAVVTDKGIINTKYIINCSGIYSDHISKMAGDNSYTIHPRRGVMAILDKEAKPIYNCITAIISPNILREVNEQSKGGVMGRTPESNLLAGPSAVEIEDRENQETNKEELEYSMSLGTDPNVGNKDIIRLFSGLRAADYMEDFVIELSDVTAGFINCGAIQSPGLASAPAIAQMVENILIDDYKKNGKEISKKENWNPIRKKEIQFSDLTIEEKDRMIQENPKYAKIICRCEGVTEGEIVDAIKSPIPPSSIDAIKRRTRSGMGRCQGGFCQPKVLEIIAREFKTPHERVSLKGKGSEVLLKDSRGSAAYEEN